MSKRGKRIYVRLRDMDLDRTGLIQTALGLSRSAVIQLAIVALSRQMGMEKEFPENFLNKK